MHAVHILSGKIQMSLGMLELCPPATATKPSERDLEIRSTASDGWIARHAPGPRKEIRVINIRAR